MSICVSLHRRPAQPQAYTCMHPAHAVHNAGPQGLFHGGLGFVIKGMFSQCGRCKSLKAALRCVCQSCKYSTCIVSVDVGCISRNQILKYYEMRDLRVYPGFITLAQKYVRAGVYIQTHPHTWPNKKKTLYPNTQSQCRTASLIIPFFCPVWPTEHPLM